MSAPYSFSAVRRALLWALALGLPACTDSFAPDAVKAPPSLLVVDGFLNARGVTTIRLSRAYAVATKGAAPTENRATVYIEDEAGTRLLLTESSVRGTYASSPQVLSPARRYRLHLNTANSREYVSEFVPVKTTPPIDTVTWRATAEGLAAYVSTHDDARATQYYRWEAEETWEITPAFVPGLEYGNSRVRSISVPYPALCWATARAPKVEISKTTALSQDVVSNYPVRQLPSTADQLHRKYSLLVQQHALTKEEYGYWELLRKNTESIGTLFDAQPSQLTGNVRCLSHPAEMALGYVGAHTLTEKRIFISRAQLPAAWRPLTGNEKCFPPDTVRLGEEVRSYGPGYLLPVYLAFQNASPVGYVSSTAPCLDCRKRGTAVRPSFWR